MKNPSGPLNNEETANSLELLVTSFHLWNRLKEFVKGLVGHLDVWRNDGVNCVMEQR